jgi:hypothetical protein
METKAGALQPAEAARSHATSVFAAENEAAFYQIRYHRMHFALLKTSSGMPLSGVDMMDCKTSTDDCSRFHRVLARSTSRGVRSNQTQKDCQH